MADKKITELQLRTNVTSEVNFPTDDTIQSYRVTAAQIRTYVYPATTQGDHVFGGASGVPTRLAAGAAGTFLKSQGSGVDPVFDNAAPVGGIQMFAGSAAPSGWLFCDGTAISRTTYAALFAIISTTYGVGDGSTTFNLPNTSGIFPRGVGTQSVSGISYTAALGTKTADKMQGHYHTAVWKSFNVAAASAAIGSVVTGDAAPITLTSAAAITVTAPITDGTNGTPRTGTETAPANIGFNFMIKY